MLVLTRKTNEEILIGNDIRLVVIEVDRGKVRLGIEAPNTTPIYRKELKEKIERERATDIPG